MDDRNSPRFVSDASLVKPLSDLEVDLQPHLGFMDSQTDDKQFITPKTESAPQDIALQSFFDPSNEISLRDYSFQEDLDPFSPTPIAFERTQKIPKASKDQTVTLNNLDGIFLGANAQQDTFEDSRSKLQQQTYLSNEFSYHVHPSSQSDTIAAASKAAEYAKVEKSRRARNAANQRYSKQRITRDKSSGIDDLENNDHEGTHADEMKEKYREKNKLAAGRCRAKKKVADRDVKDSYRHLSATNLALKKQVEALRRASVDLRTLALDHQGCNCQISQYNTNQAGLMRI